MVCSWKGYHGPWVTNWTDLYEIWQAGGMSLFEEKKRYTMRSVVRELILLT